MYHLLAFVTKDYESQHVVIIDSSENRFLLEKLLLITTKLQDNFHAMSQLYNEECCAIPNRVDVEDREQYPEPVFPGAGDHPFSTLDPKYEAKVRSWGKHQKAAWHREVWVPWANARAERVRNEEDKRKKNLLLSLNRTAPSGCPWMDMYSRIDMILIVPSKELTLLQSDGGCPKCGKNCPITLEPDPFSSEIRGDDTPVLQCDDCQEQSRRDI